MVKVGIVGLGFMGRMHYRVYNSLEDTEVVAICDANPNIITDTQNAVGNIAGADERIDFDRLKIYSDFDQMLAETSLDAVSITLPTFLHPDFSIRALDAGLNILCEKPMALNKNECEKMITAAERTGKILQIGHCIRFWPEYDKTKQIIDSGRYGSVLAASFRRLGSPPTWGDADWFADESKSGGMILDLHIHDTDYIQYLFGIPKAVQSFAAKNLRGSIGHIVTQYIYDNNSVITAEGGWFMTPGFGFEMSFNIMLEKATITYDCTRSPAFKVCPANGENFTPDIEPGDGYSRQIEYFINLIQGRKMPTVITLKQSQDSVMITNAERQSVRVGKKISLHK